MLSDQMDLRLTDKNEKQNQSPYLNPDRTQLLTISI